MAILNIRDLPDDVHVRLRVRAAQKGRSMEAEARAILVEVCSQEGSVNDAAALPSWVDALYGDAKPDSTVDDLLAERRREASRE